MTRGVFSKPPILAGIIAMLGIAAGTSAAYSQEAAPTPPMAPPATTTEAVEYMDEGDGGEEEPAEDEGLLPDNILLPADSPLSVDALYTNDTFNNSRGGIKDGTASHGLVDLVLRTNLDAIDASPIGGTLVLHGQNSHGPFLNDFVGSTQSTNINAHDFTRMAEYYWERNFDDGLAVVRLGRQVGAIQFSVMDLASDFLYGAFIISPNNPLPWYPNPTVAATADIALAEGLRLTAGSFAGGPPSQLTTWGWSQDGQVYSIAQLKYSYSIDGLPGDIQNGTWYSSGNYAAIDGSRNFVGNYGIYGGIDQMVWLEDDEDTKQGLGLFGIYSFAPQDRNNIQNHFASGIVYRGFLPGRDGDVTGVGYTIADFSNARIGLQQEHLVELFYKINITSTMILQPAIQFISAPSGFRQDTVVAGFRFGCEL
jgi:porin